MTRVIENMEVKEISAVDKPAQVGAKVLIIKRDTGDRPVLLTVADDSGHSHLLELNTDYDSNRTSYATTSSSDNNSHSHPFIIKNGVAVIGEMNGHSHEVDPADVTVAQISIAIAEAVKEDLKRAENSTFKSLVKVDSFIKLNKTKKRKSKKTTTNQTASDGGYTKSEDVTMEKNAKEPTVESLTEDVAIAKSENAVLKSIVELSTVNREHYNTLGKVEAVKFLALNDQGKDEQVGLAKSANPVVYTSLKGVNFYKSDDQRLIDMAKEADNDREIAKAARERSELLILEKRAGDELQYMPGSVGTRVALLKAIDGIEDSEVRDEVLKSVKSRNAGLGKNFTVVGESGEATIEKSQVEAEQELETLAKALAKEKGIHVSVAYAQVADQNPSLYQKAVETG